MLSPSLPHHNLHIRCISICQHNILAPLWVGEIYKQLPCYQEYVSPDRINVTLTYLRKITNADVYCLCEVEERLLPRIREMMPEYRCYYGANQHGFWTQWLEDRQWVSNGTCVLVRSDMFNVKQAVRIDLGDGCRCTMVQCTTPHLTIVSVHFDTTNRKYIEAEVLLKQLSNIQGSIIVAGDYNFTNVNMFKQHGYLETVRHPSEPALGGSKAASGFESTSGRFDEPGRFTEAASGFESTGGGSETPRGRFDTTPLPQGMIDHTLVKHAVPLLGKIETIKSTSGGSGITFGYFKGDNTDRSVADIVSTICKTVHTNGSDHYATVSKVILLGE